MSSRDMCIDLEDLVAGYGGLRVLTSRGRICGGMICIVGPNGSGKTTLLKTIAGLLKPVGGSVLVEGQRIWELGLSERTRIFGVHLSQIPSLPLFTSLEVALLGRTPVRGMVASDDDRKAAEEALRSVGAGHLAGRFFNTLSDGEKRRVMIAMALARRPRALILDEPTSFLDPVAKLSIFRLLKQLSRKILVIMATHDVDLAARYCDRIYYIEGGELREAEDLSDLARAYGSSIIFDPFSMGFERPMPGEARRVHVIGGCGSASILARRLAAEARISSGPLYPNDADAIVIKILGGEVVTTLDPDPVGASKALASSSDTVVLVRVPDYCRPRGYAEVIEHARAVGKSVVELDPRSLGLPPDVLGKGL